MDLQQAYKKWSQNGKNKDLWISTRSIFTRAWATLFMGKPCEYYTERKLGEALAVPKMSKEDKVKAASVMLHVLSYAHELEPKVNPEPTFQYGDLLKYLGDESEQPKISTQESIKKAEAEQAKRDLESHTWAEMMKSKGAESIKREQDMEPKKQRGRQPRPVIQLDPKTLEVVKVYPSFSEAERATGACNLDRAVSRYRMSVGYYWCNENDKDNAIEQIKAKQLLAGKPKTKSESTVVRTSRVKVDTVLENISDEALFKELKRRGFEGTLEKKIQVTI